MSTKPGPKKTKKPKKHDWSFYAIIICAIALVIPASILGASALSAYFASSKPIIGERFDKQYDHVIENEQKTAIKTSLSALEGVSEVQIELITGTLRVYLMVGEDYDKDAYDDLMSAAYDSVTTTLPVESYFTKDDTFHRYDLEIHLFNMRKVTPDTKPNFIYYTLIKSALVEEPARTFVTDPLSQEFVDQLWEISEETDKPDEETETELPEAINPGDVSTEEAPEE